MSLFMKQWGNLKLHNLKYNLARKTTHEKINVHCKYQTSQRESQGRLHVMRTFKVTLLATFRYITKYSSKCNFETHSRPTILGRLHEEKIVGLERVSKLHLEEYLVMYLKVAKRVILKVLITRRKKFLTRCGNGS